MYFSLLVLHFPDWHFSFFWNFSFAFVDCFVLDLQKQHRLQLEELKKGHEDELQNLKSELQHKIDDLEVISN